MTTIGASTPSRSGNPLGSRLPDAYELGTCINAARLIAEARFSKSMHVHPFRSQWITPIIRESYVMRTHPMDVAALRRSKKETAVLVIGPARPTATEKVSCVDLVTWLVDQGWVVAAHWSTVIGQLVRPTTSVSGGTIH